jgi:hypothetical protein
MSTVLSSFDGSISVPLLFLIKAQVILLGQQFLLQVHRPIINVILKPLDLPGDKVIQLFTAVSYKFL